MSVEKIYNMGDDALQNLFDLSISPISYINDLTSTLLRVQNFTIPSVAVNTYEVPYKTLTIDKPSGKVETVREFSFDIRVDRYWTVYKGLVLWKNAIQNQYTGTIGDDNINTNYRVGITVWAIQPDGTPVPSFGSWRFAGSYPKQIGDVSFDYTSGDPVIVPVTFGCLALDDTGLGDFAT
jgi:hypothetical protein